MTNRFRTSITVEIVSLGPSRATIEARPERAADRAPAHGRTSLPPRGPVGCCRRGARRPRRLIGKCRAGAAAGNVSAEGEAIRSNDYRKDTTVKAPSTRPAAVLGLDVGKSSHWACLIDRDGEVLASAPVRNREAELDALFASAPAGTLVVVDQFRNIGSLAVRRARAAGLGVAYLPGLAASVSATVKTTNFAIALQPIPPTQFPQSRQRIFTISTNAGAYASTDKRTMLSGGAAVAEKNLIGELDMYREAGIKPNFSDIAKRYGKDRHTVAAYWRAEGGRPRDGRADRAGSFDAHIEEVAAKAQLPGVTKKGIHEWLLHRYPGEDLAGYNAFTQFMRKNGIAVGASVGPEPHPRFETPPGLQLQFDWKESVRMANRDGELFEFNVFAATLGHSRRHIFIRSGTRTTDDLVRCMYATIARLGGVPREWVTDNMSALVTVKGGRRLKVQRAYEFAKAAGFELKLCRPRSPQTKGKVESSNRFLSRLAAYQGDFDGWDDIDEIIARIEDASNSEPNETTGLPPSALFMEEKDALLPVGNLRALEEAMGDVVRVARVPATMLVSAHGEPMSVPRRCIGRPARIVCMPGGAMDCYVGGELVATHVAGGPAYDPAHYAEAMAGKRWFGDAAGDIEAAAAANLGLLDSIGGSL